MPANQAVFDEPVGEHEEEIQPGLAVNGFQFEGDHLIEDID